jgi:uncharacterized protein YlbG (UPF0298 family)
MRLAFKAKVKKIDKTITPDLGKEYFTLINSGVVMYNADKTECVCIIEPIDETVVEKEIKAFGFKKIDVSEYPTVENEYKNFTVTVNETAEDRKRYIEAVLNVG